MAIYIIAYIFILYLVINIRHFRAKKLPPLLIVWIFFITLICGCRDMLGGYDSYIYAEVFDATSDQLDAGVPFYKSAAFSLNETELGFGLYNVIIATITANRYIFFLISAIFIFYSITYHITKVSRHPILAFFILWGMWYFFSFTYMRQVMAACICWYAIPFAIKRKPIPFFLIVTLAISFHNSAILFSLLYFIVNKRFTEKQILQYVAISLLLGLTPIGYLIFNLIGGSINEEKAAIAVAHQSSGRLDYIIEAVFFLFFIIHKYKDISTNRMSLCMLNVSLLFIFILTFFVRFSDGGRMSWYFILGIASTMAQISMKGKDSVNIKIIITVVVSLLYFRIVFGWGNLLSPYKTFFENKVRENDIIWAQYEYDHNYDDDKLYRAPLKLFRK